MPDATTAIVLVLLLLLGLASGLPVALVLIVGGVATFYFIEGLAGIAFLGSIAWSNSFVWEMSAIPLFVLMGYLLEASGFVKHLFRMLVAWVGWIPGSLAVVSLLTCGAFAAMSSSGSATAATMGTVVRPEAERYGYDKRLMLGVLNAGADLAPVIPPSIALIVYGSLTQTSILDLFAAGLIPGLVALAVMVGYVMVVAIRNPRRAPVIPTPSLNERISTLWILPVSAVVVVFTVGGLLVGWYTPTEAGSVGVVLSLFILFASTRFRIRETAVKCWTCLKHALTAAGFIVMLIVAGFIFSHTLTVFGFPHAVAAAIEGARLEVWQFMAVMVVLLLVLGMFVDSTTMQILTVPFLLPALHALDINLVWFGIFHVFMVEIGTNSPPFGIHLFILQKTMGASYEDAVWGAMPFSALWLAIAILVLCYPPLALWLPSQM